MYEKSQKEVEDVRSHTVCVRHRSYDFQCLPTGSLLTHPISTFWNKRPVTFHWCFLQLLKSQANTVMSVIQPRGSTYMVMETGTARGAVNVTVVISVLLWGYLQCEEDCWDSQQLFFSRLQGTERERELWMTFNLVETGERGMWMARAMNEDTSGGI